MIPVRDDNPTRSVPFMTISLVAVNVLVFFYELSLRSEHHVNAFFANFALIPAEIAQELSSAALRSVFTSMFLHGGWLHLIFNMWFLWIFGDNVEDSVGHFKFVVFYLLCGVAAAAVQVASAPRSHVPMVGASGAIAGVLGAYLLLFPGARVLVLFPLWIFIKFIYLPAWLLLIFWFGLQLLSGWTTVGGPESGGVAFWAHVGGFVAGLVLIPLFKKRHVRLFQ
jgi:membrane associated rhomboid family serine protease